MIKAKYILASAAAAMLLSSCSDDQLDRINTDEQHPSSALISGELSITDAEVSTIYNTVDQSYAWYTASYTEQECGTGNNQLKNIELRLKSEMASSSTFANEWNQTYSNLFNLKDIIGKCAAGGVNGGNHALLGMAQTVAALNWGILTDLHGDIPCSEALGGASAPKLDKQKDVYDHIFALLDSAVVNLSAGSASAKLSTHDVFFAGDMKQWIGLAHALKARYKLHTIGRDNSALQEALNEAQTAVSGGFTGAVLDAFKGDGKDNAWSAYHFSRYYTASSTTVYNLLAERSDPRSDVYNYNGFGPGPGAGAETPGDRTQAQATETMNYPMWLDNGDATMHIFSASELYFIIAECKARLGQDASAEFKEGVEESVADILTASAVDNDFVDQLASAYNITFADKTTSLSAKISAVASAYAASLSARYAAAPLSEILIQKYIAQSRDEQVETYNDIRRCTFVDGSYPVKLTNPNNTQNGGRPYWPNMLPYGESDVTNNPNVTAAFGSGSDAGEYIFNNKVWWAGGE